MKRVFAPLIFFALLVTAAPALAKRGCGYKVFPRGDWQAQQLPIDGGRRCFMKFSPKDGGEEYRSYNFSSDGLVMIFIGIGAPVSSNTGARTYYFWPTEEVPLIAKEKKGDKTTQIRSASGEVWAFDRRTQALVDIEGCEFDSTSKVSWDSEGGVHIKKCRGRLVVDAGFMRGKQSTQDPERTALVTDPSGASCVLQVRDFIDLSRGRDHPRPRFSRNEDIRAFLASHPSCGKLDLSMFETPLPLARTPAAVKRGD